LALKGSHKYDASKVLIYEAEYALEQTYNLLELLLKAYREYKKRKIDKGIK
jgi:hypothetical protein